MDIVYSNTASTDDGFFSCPSVTGTDYAGNTGSTFGWIHINRDITASATIILIPKVREKRGTRRKLYAFEQSSLRSVRAKPFSKGWQRPEIVRRSR